MEQKKPSHLKETRESPKREFESFPCAIYQTRTVDQKGLLVKHHWHDEIEIIHFPCGNFTMEINMKTYRVTQECLYFINPGELHSITCSKANSKGDDAVLFHPSLLSFESYDSAQMKLVRPIQNEKMLFPRVLMADHPAFEPILEAFSDVFHSFGIPLSEENPIEKGAFSDDVTNQLFIKSALLRILAILSSYHLFVPTDKNYNRKVEGIKKALTYIEENYNQKIYISDLAAQLNINEQYFCRYFKKAIGCTPIEYINAYRIRKARHFLDDTDLSVTEVCFECGYNNLGNFFREFKRYTSTTPLQYRKSQNSEI